MVTYTTRAFPADFLKRLRILSVHSGGSTGRATIQDTLNYVVALGLREAEADVSAKLQQEKGKEA